MPLHLRVALLAGLASAAKGQSRHRACSRRRAKRRIICSGLLQARVPLLDEDYLILSTIHSAKGQEWKSVAVLNVVDGCMPSDLGAGISAEVEEERRLLYVPMTRAKDDLHLVVPQRFFTHGQHSHGDRHVYASRTRLIPEKLLGLFERTRLAGRLFGPQHVRSPSQGPRSTSGRAYAGCGARPPGALPARGNCSHREVKSTSSPGTKGRA